METRTARNVLFNLLGHAAPLVAAVLCIPGILSHLGRERFGLLSLSWVLIGYFSLFDLGLGRALTRAVATELGRRDERAAQSLVATGLVLMSAIGTIAAFLLVASRSFIASALSEDGALSTELVTSFLWIALAVPPLVASTGLRGVLEAHQRFDLVNAVRVPLGLSNSLLPWLLTNFDFGLEACVAALSMSRILAFVGLLVLCRSVDALPRSLRVTRGVVKQLAKDGAWMTVSNVISPLMANADRFLIASLLGLASVAVYTTPYDIVSKFLLVPTAVAGVLFSRFASQNDTGQLERTFGLASRLMFLGILVPICVTIAISDQALAWWIGPEFAADSARVTRWLAAGVFFNALAYLPFALLQARGKASLTSRIHLIEFPLYIGGVILCAQIGGIDGVAIAWCARVSIDAMLLYWCASRELRRSAPLRSGAYWIATASLAIGVAFLQADVRVRVLLAAGTATAVVVYSWRRMFSAEERLQVTGVVRGLLRFGPGVSSS